VCALLVAGTAACAPLPGGSVGPVAGGIGDTDEQVRVGSFAVIDGVAVSRRFVYAVGPGGVAVYDRFAERWMSPATRDLERELGGDMAGGAGGTGMITALAGDPVEEALWIGVPGAVISYRPFTGQVQRTMLTGVPQRIVFDRAGTGDALVFSGGQWTRVSRVGITTPMAGAPVASQVIVPPTLADLLARFPALRAQPQLLVQAPLPNRPRQPFALSAGAASPDRANELWLGTRGDGLVRLDAAFSQGTPMRFGLLDPGAGALARAADGVWVAGLGRSPSRGGLTFTTFDLQRWRWVEGTIGVPLAGVRTFAMATRERTAWLATDRGLVRVQLDGEQDMTSYTTLSGLPDDRVFAVAAHPAGAWAGTARGVAFVQDDRGAAAPDVREEPAAAPKRGVGATRLAGQPVFALQVTGKTLWVGTMAGLLSLPVDAIEADDAPVRATAGSDPALRRPVRALAASDSVLLAVTDDAVLHLVVRRTASGFAEVGQAERLPALEPRLVGEPTRLAVDARAMALAGRDGLLLLSRASGASRVLRVPADLPGPVLDVLLEGEWLFLATPQGLWRWRRTRDGLVP